MKFEHFLGTDLCDNLEGIVQIMKKQNENGFNEFWISIEKPFPLMAVLTSKSIAHVHFFDEDGSPGFSALSDCNLGLDIDQTCVFYTNTNEIIEVENEYILSIDRAIEIVQEFFITKQIPKCIEWDEL